MRILRKPKKPFCWHIEVKIGFDVDLRKIFLFLGIISAAALISWGTYLGAMWLWAKVMLPAFYWLASHWKQISFVCFLIAIATIYIKYWKKIPIYLKYIGGVLIIAGYLITCVDKSPKEDKEPKMSAKEIRDHNSKLFDNSIAEMKVFLTYVENCASVAYYDNVAKFTIGYGCTGIISANGKGADGSVLIKEGQTMSIKEADEQKNRYFKYRTKPSVLKYIKVPLSQEELIACVALSYCVGEEYLYNSDFARAINSGIKGEKLAHLLGGFRKQKGVPKRLYPAALILANKIKVIELLDWRTESCYSIADDYSEICVYKNDSLYKDANNHIRWRFDAQAVANIRAISQKKTYSAYVINPKGTKERLFVRDLLLPKVVSSL